ncbi:glycosyltransferase family 90 protein [Polychaeton citri CBS 116435]|uniref:Glycosyltransferase family 90 protein n=1 Tax=Polychaeton citri CBS 116435 TaxID=1314669 RepID=A0A9P4UK52_9PEZI|nr:glycosyltransferase family 90 protein [Polychaeton citri CBS 116435]
MPVFAATSLGNRFTQLTAAAIILTVVFWFILSTSNLPTQVADRFAHTNRPVSDTSPLPIGNHPIDQLIREADTELYKLLGKASHTLDDAADAYRKRRGRQPPPLFDAWYAFAQNKTAVIVEDFFDQIYEDLNPFWGLSAKFIRESAKDFEHRVTVRNHSTTWVSDKDDRPWMHLWSDLVRTIQDVVPDVDIAINVMDESRLIVPWEEITEYVAKEKETRSVIPVEKLKRTTYQSLKTLDDSVPEHFDPAFIGGVPFWELAVAGCHPDSPGRKAPIETNFTLPPPLQTRQPRGSYQGYVKNWTLSKQPCEYAEMQGLHGTFVEPISESTSKKLFPLFGGSKLPMNNEILLPAAMYWTEDPFYSGGKSHGGVWEEKYEKLIWRGAASGGRNKKENWTRFQRHRFLSMVNGTSVALAENDDPTAAPNFAVPEVGQYGLSAFKKAGQSLGTWVSSWSDAAFVHLLCFPEIVHKLCEYTDPYFSLAIKEMPMSEQYNYKYLPDIDGNSFSGRYRGFLGSTSLPIKATIYNEWHDSRMVAWKHFVPMDNTFVDIYGIMEYFIGNKATGVQGHDEQARSIALDGKKWAETVLRKEDMQVYVLRLLLEYARLCDDDRDSMGWAGDVT